MKEHGSPFQFVKMARLGLRVLRHDVTVNSILILFIKDGLRKAGLLFTYYVLCEDVFVFSSFLFRICASRLSSVMVSSVCLQRVLF